MHQPPLQPDRLLRRRGDAAEGPQGRREQRHGLSGGQAVSEDHARAQGRWHRVRDQALPGLHRTRPCIEHAPGAPYLTVRHISLALPDLGPR